MIGSRSVYSREKLRQPALENSSRPCRLYPLRTAADKIRKHFVLFRLRHPEFFSQVVYDLATFVQFQNTREMSARMRGALPPVLQPFCHIADICFQMYLDPATPSTAWLLALCRPSHSSQRDGSMHS